MSRAVDKELSLLLRAGYKLVALESFEEERAVRAATRAAEACERELHTWSLANGVDGAGKGAGSLEACMRALDAIEKPALFALLDAHMVLAEPLGLRRLRDALAKLGKRRQSIVLIAPLLDLPLELEREAGRVALPLPIRRRCKRCSRRCSTARRARRRRRRCSAIACARRSGSPATRRCAYSARPGSRAAESAMTPSRWSCARSRRRCAALPRSRSTTRRTTCQGSAGSAS